MSEFLQGGAEMNELMSTKMCSPLIIYLGVIVTSGLSVYLTRDHLKRHNSNKMDNLFNLYSLNELKFMLVLGLIMFGLCQYNKTTLAWVFLIFPIIYLLIQNIIVHIHVSSAVQSAPKQAPVVGEQRYGVEGGAMVIPKDTHQEVQQQRAIYVPPPPKNTEMPATTSMSTPLGAGGGQGPVGLGGSSFGGAGSGGVDSYAYF